MKYENIDPLQEENGDYCHKKCPGCFCAVGWPYEKQCPDCRDNWRENEFRNSYCICPPPDKPEILAKDKITSDNKPNTCRACAGSKWC